MNRRDFFIRIGGMVVAVPPILHLVACGDGGGGGDSAGGTGGTSNGDDLIGETTESAGHVHTVTVHCADVLAGDAVTYTSSKTSGHTHGVTLNSVQLSKLAAGESVTFETNSLHLHTWVISPGDGCA